MAKKSKRTAAVTRTPKKSNSCCFWLFRILLVLLSFLVLILHTVYMMLNALTLSVGLMVGMGVGLVVKCLGVMGALLADYNYCRLYAVAMSVISIVSYFRDAVGVQFGINVVTAVLAVLLTFIIRKRNRKVLMPVVIAPGSAAPANVVYIPAQPGLEPSFSTVAPSAPPLPDLPPPY